MFLVPADLAPFADIDSARAEAMIRDAEAMAALAAPCITDPTFQGSTALVDAVVAVLRQAILRWHDAGTGATQTQISGPFSQTTQFQARRGMFWPSEIADLQSLCETFSGADNTSRAFSFVPTGSSAAGGPHSDWCNLLMGGTHCSCGANLTNYQYPLYDAP